MAQLSVAEEAKPSFGEVLDFMRLVWALDSGLDAVSGEMEALLNLTGAQRLVLRVLAEYPPLSQTELADVLGMNRTRVAHALRGLEEAHYVRRRPTQADRRRTIVSLTARGVKVSEALASVVEGAVRKVLCKVTGRTVDAAKQVMGALVRELSQDVSARMRRN